MAKLYFNYGTMNSSKSAQLLMTAHNYISQGKDVIAIKPDLDTRWKTGHIISRALEFTLECHLINDKEDVYELVTSILRDKEIYAVLVDEAQFLTVGQVEKLVKIVDTLDIPVICFGLKNSYKSGVLFEGSAALLYYADRLNEIKTICKYCNKKATMNLRINDDKAVYSGDIVVIGDTDTSGDYYIPVCREHYFNPLLTIKK